MVNQVNLFGEKVKVLEADVMREITQYLQAKHVFFWRNNSGAYSDKEAGRFIRFGFKGSPDFLAVFPGDKNGLGKGKLWCIEAKKPGGLLSDDQIKFLAEARKNGAVVTVAESSYDLDIQLVDNSAPCTPRYERALTGG